MVYQSIHPRKIIGKRLHKTLDEQVHERVEDNEQEEIYINQVSELKSEFLIPRLDKFVETESAGAEDFEDIFPEETAGERPKPDQDFLDMMKDYFRP